MNKNNIIMPATIIIASIVLGGFFYATQIRLQEIKIEENRRVEEIRAEQEKKEYIVRQKDNCYKIYLQEKENWNNVHGFYYDEIRDLCIVRYKSSEPAKDKEECEKIIEGVWDIKNPKTRAWIHDIYYNCLENTFSKEF